MLAYCESCKENSLALKRYIRKVDNKPMQVWVCINKHCKGRRSEK